MDQERESPIEQANKVVERYLIGRVRESAIEVSENVIIPEGIAYNKSLIKLADYAGMLRCMPGTNDRKKK